MKRRLFWLVELFIWLFLLYVISNGIILARYHYKQSFNTYQIFLPDVDGLINGSPVRLMGIQVGYVNQVDIVGEDVYVKFVVTEKGVKLPPGSIVTVEFTGLGGSKSLEIYPPEFKLDSSDKILITQSPKRIHDSLGVLNSMFDNAANIAYQVSHFMEELGIIKKEGKFDSDKSKKSAIEEFNLSNALLDQARKKSDSFGEKLRNRKKINGDD